MTLANIALYALAVIGAASVVSTVVLIVLALRAPMGSEDASGFRTLDHDCAPGEAMAAAIIEREQCPRA